MAENLENALVLLVDDMAFRRACILKLLNGWASEADLTLVATDFEEVMALRRSACCRLVILSLGAEDVSDPRMLAIHSVLTAERRDRQIVVLGDRPGVDNIERALQLGIAGYIPTSLDADVIIAALDFVLAGGTYFPPDALIQLGAPPHEPRQLPLLASELAARRRKQPDTIRSKNDDETALAPDRLERGCAAAINISTGDLTLRQQEVLACLKRARSNKEIARDLSMSEATVKVHVRQVMKKLGALNRTHAAVLAVDLATVPERAMGPNVARFQSSRSGSHQALR